MMRKSHIFCFIALVGITSGLLFFLASRKGKINKQEKEGHSIAYEALQFISSAAAFPEADIPPDGYGKAWNFYSANFSSAASKSGSASWESMGPQNVGGRIISIAIDPIDTNIVWLGSASGGLWKSTTGGHGLMAWQYVPTGFPVLGVGAIAINPLNKNEMFIGTGETYDYGTSVNGLVERTTRGSNGIGILKSVDGGITWTHSLNWNYNQQRGVWNIVYNPLNPSTVFAATTEGVFKSTDGGLSWTVSLNYTMVMSLEMDPADTSLLYAGVGNLTSPVHGLYKTTDAGTNWGKLTNGLPLIANTGRISIDIFDGNSNIVVAHFASKLNSVGLYRSSNKGQSWVLVSTADIASYQGWYSTGLKIRDIDSNHVLIGGVSLFESLTGGSNPYPVTGYNPSAIDSLPWPDLHGLISNPLDPDKLYLLTDAGLYRSNDFGQSWRWCSNGCNVSQFYHGSVASSDSNLAIGGLQDRNSQRYNGTINWQAIDGGDGTYNAINNSDPSIQYVSSQYLFINRSVDSGYTFSNIFSGSNAAFVAPFMLAPSNNSVIYAGDVYLNYSTDEGGSWQFTGPVDNFNPIISMDVSMTDENKIYFATAPASDPFMHVFLSTDGGQSYGDISSGLPNRYPRDISVDPLNDAIAYIAFSGFGTGHIFKTINNGLTWTDISAALPDVPFHTVLVNPINPDVVFAGCDYGVFVSGDAGLTWQSLEAGLPMAVLVFDLQYSASNNSLVAFTHGNGVYKISLNGLNPGVAENVPSQNLHVYPTIVNMHLTVEFFSSNPTTGKFSIIDQAGREVFIQQVIAAAGKNRVEIAVPHLKAGIYLCRLQAGGKTMIRRIIKPD